MLSAIFRCVVILMNIKYNTFLAHCGFLLFNSYISIMRGWGKAINIQRCDFRTLLLMGQLTEYIN